MSWKRDYLQRLQPSGKWVQEKPNLMTGDLGIISFEQTASSQCPLRRVLTTFPGSDDFVRAAQVRTCEERSFRRPVQKLILLPRD